MGKLQKSNAGGQQHNCRLLRCKVDARWKTVLLPTNDDYCFKSNNSIQTFTLITSDSITFHHDCGNKKSLHRTLCSELLCLTLIRFWVDYCGNLINKEVCKHAVLVLFVGVKVHIHDRDGYERKQMTFCWMLDKTYYFPKVSDEKLEVNISL